MKKVATILLTLALAVTAAIGVSADETVTVNTTTVSLEKQPLTIELKGSWKVWTSEYHDKELEEAWGENEVSWLEWADKYNFIAEMERNTGTETAMIRCIPDVSERMGENWKDMTEDELSSIASAFIYSMSEDERNAVVGFNMHTADSAKFIVIDMYDESSGIISRMAYTVDGGNMYTFMFSKIYDGTDIQSEWNSELNTVKFEYTPRAEEKSESKINGSLFEKVGVTLMLMAVLLFCIIVYGKIKTKK